MSQTGDPGNGPPSLPLQPAARDVWDRKYRLRDATGRPLEDTPAETLARVARALADVEATPALREHWRERFLWALNHGALPAGRILANAGARDHKRGTSTINCTVSGTIHDTLDEILGKLREAGLTLQSGAGIGYEFSTLRPKGAWVAGAGARSSGPLSFMDVYDQMCRTIASAGDRRGAQMATFHIGHPDVLEFIEAKREPGRLRQFNLSLLVPDAFMAALDAGADWPWPSPEPRRAGAHRRGPAGSEAGGLAPLARDRGLHHRRPRPRRLPGAAVDTGGGAVGAGDARHLRPCRARRDLHRPGECREQQRFLRIDPRG